MHNGLVSGDTFVYTVLNGLESEAYLTHVLSIIADQSAYRVDELLPWNISNNTVESEDQ